MLYHDPAAKTHDRLGFILVMAVALHIAIILGVGFAMTIPTAPSATRLDITLSNYATEKKVDKADYLAQTNQEASGSEAAKAELSTTQIAPLNSSVPQWVNTEMEIPQRTQTPENPNEVIVTQNTSTFTTVLKPDFTEPTLDEITGDSDRYNVQTEIASLQAKLAEEQQIYAKLPRIRQASSVATRAAEDAEYLYRWQQRIEVIGNQHYPEKARAQSLTGDVQMLVAVNADGSLHQAKVLQSSGIAVLDEAALRIVRLASPFPPFSAEMKRNIDRLEIVRTWQFRQNQFQRLE